MKRRLGTVRQSIGFLVRHCNYLRAYRRQEEMRTTLVRANMELGKLGYSMRRTGSCSLDGMQEDDRVEPELPRFPSLCRRD
jgi:hypothetical protein